MRRYSMGLEPPMPLYKEQTHCFDCGRKLAGHVIRKDGKLYCNQTCIDHRVRYVATLAGQVNSPWFLGLAAILAAFMLAFTFTGGHKAWAHDPNTHQANDLSIARSKVGGQCCDGKDYHYVNPYSWERTDTGYRIHVSGKWVDVPKDAEVNNMKNPDGEAKVWLMFDENGEPYVRCFMPGMEG